MDSQRKNRAYAIGQTALLFLFAILYFITGGPRLFVWSGANTAGQVLCFVGLAIILIAIFSLRGVVQVSPEPRASGHLVTKSIYRWLRHPIYTGVLIAIVGLFLKKPTAVVAAGVAIIAIFLWLKAHYEESLLAAAYADYSEYRTTSWGLIPGFRG